MTVQPFSILVVLSFSFIFSTPSWKWRPTLFVLELRHLFLWSSGHSVQNKCQIVEEVWTMTEQVVKSKELRRQTKEWMAAFTQTQCEKCYRKGCKYMRNNFTKQKGKKVQLHIIDQSFEHNGMRISYQKIGWKALNRKRRCTLHSSMVSEGFANFIPKEERPANSRDVNALETIWIIVDEIPYKDPAPKTLNELRQWLRFAWKNVTLDTLWELVHSIPHRLEIVRKHTGRRSGRVTNILGIEC